MAVFVSRGMTRRLAVLGLLAGLAPLSAEAATVGQVDDFEDGSVMLWGGSFSGITNQTTGGPAGADDNYLRIVSTGTGGSGSRMIFFNQSQWAGDYTGIASITADVINEGSNALDLRIAVGNTGTGTWYASANAIALPTGGSWTGVQFDLSDLVSISGSEDLSDVLTGVSALRILSSAELPTIGSGGSPQGDVIAAQIGIDNITAVVPEPASAALVAMGGVCLLRRRRA